MPISPESHLQKSLPLQFRFVTSIKLLRLLVERFFFYFLQTEIDQFSNLNFTFVQKRNEENGQQSDQIWRLSDELEVSLARNEKNRKQLKGLLLLMKNYMSDMGKIREMLKVVLQERNDLRMMIDDAERKKNNAETESAKLQDLFNEAKAKAYKLKRLLETKEKEDAQIKSFQPEKQMAKTFENPRTEKKNSLDNQLPTNQWKKLELEEQTGIKIIRKLKQQFSNLTEQNEFLTQDMKNEIEKRKSVENALYEERFYREQIETILRNQSATSSDLIDKLTQEKMQVEQALHEEKFLRQETEAILENQTKANNDLVEQMSQEKTQIEQALRDEKFTRHKIKAILKIRHKMQKFSIATNTAKISRQKL